MSLPATEAGTLQTAHRSMLASFCVNPTFVGDSPGLWVGSGLSYLLSLILVDGGASIDIGTIHGKSALY